VLEGSMEKFGKYVLVKLVATGGMAEVFLAREFGISGFQRILAIKRVLPHLAMDREFIEMFTEEARLSAQLSHPNVVQVYEFGLVEDSYYIAMEYIDGLTLSDLLSNRVWKGEPIPLDLCLMVMADLCQGLDYAHNKRSLTNEPLNLVHRDISPKNVMLSIDGAVKLMDFGIAKAADSQRQETVTGTIKGKISYLSPEQVMGEKLDRRSDIFSLGIVFYEMLTSRKCFVGDNEFAILYKIRLAEVDPPSSVNPALPAEIDAILARALHPDREQRYQSAEDLLADINALRYGMGLMASASKLAVYLRGLKAPGDEDTLASLQKIDWKQVESDFGMDSTTSLRAALDTMDLDAGAADGEETAPATDTGRRRRPAGPGTGSRRIRPPAAAREGTRAGGTGKRRAAPTVEAQDDEDEELLQAGLADEPAGGGKLVPLLLAFSVVLLAASLSIFAYVLWPRITSEAALVTAQPTAIPPRADAATPPPPGLLAADAPTPSGAALSPEDGTPPEDGTAAAASVEAGGTEASASVPQPEPAAAVPAARAAPTAQPEPPPTRRPTTGTLVVRSSVPVDLYLEGRSQGRLSSSGLTLQLPAGTHNLVAMGYVASPPSYYRAELSASIEAGATRTHDVRFPELGTLNITTPKAATLFINGVRIDFTPIPKLSVTAGTHELRFEFRTGEVSRQRQQVRPGQFATVFGKP
jgi:eukaryotic-like serine/threonine-protein kinase